MRYEVLADQDLLKQDPSCQFHGVRAGLFQHFVEIGRDRLWLENLSRFESDEAAHRVRGIGAQHVHAAAKLHLAMKLAFAEPIETLGHVDIQVIQRAALSKMRSDWFVST